MVYSHNFFSFYKKDGVTLLGEVGWSRYDMLVTNSQGVKRSKLNTAVVGN